MTPSIAGWPTKPKEAPSPHEVRLALLDINPVFQSLGGKTCQAPKRRTILETLSIVNYAARKIKFSIKYFFIFCAVLEESIF